MRQAACEKNTICRWRCRDIGHVGLICRWRRRVIGVVGHCSQSRKGHRHASRAIGLVGHGSRSEKGGKGTQLKLEPKGYGVLGSGFGWEGLKGSRLETFHDLTRNVPPHMAAAIVRDARTVAPTLVETNLRACEVGSALSRVNRR